MSDAALYQTFKSVHIILVTSWFAGLFYLPRLLVYHAEAQDKPELEKTILSKQFEKMEKILFNAIMIPALWLTWISGISLIYLVWWDSFGQQPWLHLKLAFVVCITIYHFYCRHLIRSFRNQNFILSGNQLRLFNEIATILLVAVVFIVVAKNTFDWMYGLIGFVAFAIAIMSAVKIVKKLREKAN
jgi:putative membrane protein